MIGRASRNPMKSVIKIANGHPFSIEFGKYDLMRVNPSPSDPFSKNYRAEAGSPGTKLR
jgi:hypothetical protein